MNEDKNTIEKLPLKVIGNRKPCAKGLLAAEPFLKLVIELRGNKPFIPKGVHRFKTFEESNEWSIKMMARKTNQDDLKHTEKPTNSNVERTILTLYF